MDTPPNPTLIYGILVDERCFTRLRSEAEAADATVDVKQRMPTSVVILRNSATGYEVAVPDQ